eukprot:5016435-Pyramimonas_sp.AAC.1
MQELSIDILALREAQKYDSVHDISDKGVLLIQSGGSDDQGAASFACLIAPDILEGHRRLPDGFCKDHAHQVACPWWGASYLQCVRTSQWQALGRQTGFLRTVGRI